MRRLVRFIFVVAVVTHTSTPPLSAIDTHVVVAHVVVAYVVVAHVVAHVVVCRRRRRRPPSRPPFPPLSLPVFG